VDWEKDGPRGRSINEMADTDGSVQLRVKVAGINPRWTSVSPLLSFAIMVVRPVRMTHFLKLDSGTQEPGRRHPRPTQDAL
jgi:hypothetical protein